MNYRVSFTHTSEEDFKSLPKRVLETTLRQIKSLEGNITPDGKRIKKLKGLKGSFYRLRSEDYRIVFEVEGKFVTVHRIVDRKELERVISKLR